MPLLSFDLGEIPMHKLIRQLMWAIHSNFRMKAKWTKGQNDILQLLEAEIPQQITTIEDAKRFLDMNSIDYWLETDLQNIELDSDIPISFILVFSCAGPTLWSNLMPKGHQYTIVLGFNTVNILELIDVNMMELHI